MHSDYEQAGLACDPPGARIERLEEALSIIRSMWAGSGTRFEGRHYRVTDLPHAAELPPGERPRILIGGGGRRVLGVAGRHADIVGINATMHEGRVTSATPRDLAPERVREKVRWVREAAEAAGRDAGAIELHALTFVLAMTEEPRGIREALARNSGMTPEQVADCPIFLTGPPSEIRDRLEKRREETGISYVAIQGREMAEVERFAEAVVAPLAGR
jgi:alkanesulfonate monooxygenase SsuD/methylene tetrahydromethanopterin reductase-like flavin-dependent oxidoreductase (luciferase family)